MHHLFHATRLNYNPRTNLIPLSQFISTPPLSLKRFQTLARLCAVFTNRASVFPALATKVARSFCLVQVSQKVTSLHGATKHTCTFLCPGQHCATSAIRIKVCQNHVYQSHRPGPALLHCRLLLMRPHLALYCPTLSQAMFSARKARPSKCSKPESARSATLISQRGLHKRYTTFT